MSDFKMAFGITALLLFLTNVRKIYGALLWISEILFRPPAPHLVPLWNIEGKVVGHVLLDESKVDLPKKDPVQLSIVPADARPYRATHEPATDPELLTLAVWDGWPDGAFSCDLTLQSVQDTNQVSIHWVHSSSRGFQGRASSKTWKKGKEIRRRCLGAIKCNSRHCGIIIAPHPQASVLRDQLEPICVCGARLLHRECGITMNVWFYEDGAHVLNSGNHTHGAYTHTLSRPGVHQPFALNSFVAGQPVELRRAKSSQNNGIFVESDTLPDGASELINSNMLGDKFKFEDLTPEEQQEIEQDSSADREESGSEGNSEDKDEER